MNQVVYNDLIKYDLRDDLEYLGSDRKDFQLNILIGKNISKAFAFGYNFDEFAQELWIPISIRKKMRHLHEEMDKYMPQLKWLNEKLEITDEGKDVNVIDYTNYILQNAFIDSDEDALNLAIVIGRVLKSQKNQ